MKKKSRIIFCCILCAAFLGTCIFAAINTEGRKSKEEEETGKEERNLLYARLSAIHNTYDGVEYTFLITYNMTREEEQYVNVRFRDNERYSADIDHEHMSVGSDVKIEYRGELTEYINEWNDRGEYFTLNIQDIISILVDD